MRQFLALELPAELRAALGELVADLRRLRGWRLVRSESVHLTLRFLGEVEDAQDRAARPLWRAAAAASRPPDLRIGGVGTFPQRGRARVLWLGVSDRAGALVPLATALEGVARQAGFAAEERPFRPHLTLGRARRDGRPEVPRLDWSWDGVMRPVEVVLFRSDLGPGGARYTALERFPLSVGTES